jgi:FKBP12-rapamycin complex-associated protein
LQVQGRWYEKLHEWDKALSLYRAEMDADHAHDDVRPHDEELVLHQMRCLEALAQWQALNELAKQHWQLPNAPRQKMAVVAANGAWAAGAFPCLLEVVFKMAGELGR